MPGYVVDLDFDAKVGAWSISLIGLCNVIGAFYSGVLSGKRPMRKILSLIYLARVVAISLFLIVPVSLTSILVFSAMMGGVVGNSASYIRFSCCIFWHTLYGIFVRCGFS